MSISKRLRYEILRRDDHMCRYCGAKAPDVSLTVDHVLPISLGGGDQPSNLVTACVECNQGKAASNPDAPIVEGVDDDALRWAVALERAQEMQANTRGADREYADKFLFLWRDHYIEEVQADESKMDLPGDWRTSLARFHAANLEADVLVTAIDATMAHNRLPNKRLFRYFCGICWRVLDERIEIAKSLIDTEGDAE